MSKQTRYTIRLQDPNQPARVYRAEATTPAAARREARELEKGVLIGGLVQIYEEGAEDPIDAWDVW